MTMMGFFNALSFELAALEFTSVADIEDFATSPFNLLVPKLRPKTLTRLLSGKQTNKSMQELKKTNREIRR